MSVRFSVIIPVLNEEAQLEATLRAAQLAFGNAAEYIVVDGGSCDATVDRAQACGALVLQENGGRGPQLDTGFRHSRGAFCVFLHADTLLPANAASAIEKSLQRRDVVGGAFRLQFTRESPLPLLLYVLERAINARSRLLRTATGDQAIFARRKTLERIGGVPRVPIFEDVRLYGALRKVGSIELLEASVATSPRLWRQVGAVRGMLLHIIMRGLHALGVPPATLVRLYPPRVRPRR